MSPTQATNGSSATSPASSLKKAADVKCVQTTKGWVCAICFPLDDPSRALERVLSLAQLQAHAAANHYASLGQITKSVYYEAQFKGQRDLGLDGSVMQGPPTAASQKKLTKQAGVPKRKYVRKNKTVVPESALDLMETMINFDGTFNVNDDHFSTDSLAFPGGSQDEDNDMINFASAPNTPHTPYNNAGSYNDQSVRSRFGMDVSPINKTPTTPPTAIGSNYDQPSHSQSEMGVSHATTTPTTPHSSNDSYYDQSTHSRFGMHSTDAPQSVASPSTPSRKKSSASKNPLRQRLSENPSFESAVSVHGLDQVRAAGNVGLQRYLDRQARGLPRTANGSLPLTSPSAPRNGTLGLPLTAANYAAAGMPNLPVEKVVRRTKKVERRRQSSTASSIAGGPDGDASPLVAVSIDTSLNQFGVPATLFGQAPGAVYKSHAYQSIYAVLAPKEQLPLPEVSLPEIPAGLYLPELAHSEDSGAVDSSHEQFQGDVFGASEPMSMGNDGAQDFNFESFSSEPWSSSEENATAHGNAVPPMSNEAFAEFLASISNPAVSEIDAMFGFGDRSNAPSNMYDNFTVFHTTSLEYGVPSETVRAARPASSSSRSTPPVVEGSLSSTPEVVEPLVGSSDRVELAPEVIRPSAIESVAEVSVPEAETRVFDSPEMAELKSFFQKQLEEQQTKFEAALRKQSEGQSAAIKQLEEKSAEREKRARGEKARTKAAAAAEYERARLEARQKLSNVSNNQLFGIVPSRTVGHGKPTVTTKDNAKKRVGPSKKPVPAKSHTPVVVKEAVPAAKKTSPGGQKLASAAKKAPVGGQKPVSATTKVGVPSTKMTTFSLFTGAPSGFKRTFVKNHGVKVATNKPLTAAFDQLKATPTPAKPTVRTQSASVPKKRAAAPKPAPSGQKPSGVTKKAPSRDRNSDQKYLARAMLSKKGPQRVNVPDLENGGWKWVNVSEL
ncbi:hypothetical protein EYC80_003950 [Monilinia laxa]|uniref:Uncharacterized protein n=1 Tax=Monilinia laxa TaxID=61186 RepID=A0A5N6KLS3_MONLA|nr:hypothetical protein EYC80_003950 [Monilinia laxa]